MPPLGNWHPLNRYHTTPQVGYQSCLWCLSAQPACKNSPLLIAEAQPLRDYRQFVQRPVSTVDYLRDLQACEFENHQAEAQQQLMQEQIRLAQAQRKAAKLQQWAAQQQLKAKSSTPALQLIDKKYLNRRQKLLNNLFGGKMFVQADMPFPYKIRNGQKVPVRNIQQMAAVADWILFKQKTDGQWSDHKVKILKKNLSLNGRDMLPSKLDGN